MPASNRRTTEPVRSKKANSVKAAAKATAPAKTAEQIAQEEHDALVTAASKLIYAVTYSPLAEVKRLLKEGAPTWYQEESMGWNCLHFAAERGDADVVKACLGLGAVWNAGKRQQFGSPLFESSQCFSQSTFLGGLQETFRYRSTTKSRT